MISVTCFLVTAGCASTGGERSNPDAVPVIATGTGSTAVEAREDAMLLAAEKVVGSYIISETSLREEEIREEIVSLRAGIIDDIEVLKSEELPGGGWSVKALVYVNTEPLTAKLMGVGAITEGSVDGRKLAETTLARRKSKARFTRDAREVLREVMEGFPEDYLVLEETEELKILDDTSTRSAMIEVEYALSYDKYEEVLLPVLDRLLTDVGRYRARFRVGDHERHEGGSVISSSPPVELAEGIHVLAIAQGPPSTKPSVRLTSPTSLSIQGKSFPVREYEVDLSSAQAVRGAISGGGTMKGQLTGYTAGGDVLFVETAPIGGGRSERDFCSNWMHDRGTMITPFPLSTSRGWEYVGSNLKSVPFTNLSWASEPKVTFRVKVPFSTLEKLTRVEARVVIK